MNARLVDATIAEIIVPADRLRKVLPDRVETFLSDYRAKGIMTPIELVEVVGGMRLVFGAHRLAAVLAAGDPTIPALLHPFGSFGTEADIRLREISENFFRFELTVLEHAVHIAEWRSIHEAANPPAKRGPKKKLPPDEAMEELSANFALNFTDVVQRTLGLSRRAIFLALKVATIAAPVRDAIAALPVADNQTELLLLAGQSPDRQTAIAAFLLSNPAATVVEAIAAIDGVPPPRPMEPHEKLSEAFSRLSQTEQQRFFTLHEEAITLWLARKGN